MSDSEEDDVPISKMVTRLRQQQKKGYSESKGDTPPPSPATQTPPPSPSSNMSESGKEQSNDEKETQTTEKSTNESGDEQYPDKEESTEGQKEQAEDGTEEETGSSKPPENDETSDNDGKDNTPEPQKEVDENLEQNESTSVEDTTAKEDHAHAQPINTTKTEKSSQPTHGGEPPTDSETQQDDPVKMNTDVKFQATPVKEESTQSKNDTTDNMEVEAEATDDKLAETAPVPKTSPESEVKIDPGLLPGDSKSSDPHEANSSTQTQRVVSIPRVRKKPDIEELQDAFPLLVVPKKRKKGSRNRANKRKAGKIQIQFGGSSKGAESTSNRRLRQEKKTSVEDSMRRFETDLYRSFPDNEEDFDVLHKFEDSLAFYSEPHEDQDPVFIEFNRKMEKQKLEKELARLEEKEVAGKNEIDRIIATQLNEKQASADRNIERLRTKANMEEQRDLQKLLEIYKQKTASNQSRINEGVKVLGRRHHQELEKAAIQYRQQAQQQRLPEQVANAEWAKLSQQLQSKQQRQLQEFTTKGEEVKKKCEGDYKREQEKLRNHHEKKKQDMEHGMSKILARMHSNFYQQRQRHLQRHFDKMKKIKETIMSRNQASEAVDAKGDNDEKPSNPDGVAQDDSEKLETLKSTIVPLGEKDGEKAAALARHKNRKTLLGVIPKQLSIEIHNEGIWISSLLESKKEDSRKNQDSDNEFIPWGVQARTVLHSIVCGEIPFGYGSDRFDFGDAIATQGGYLRCVVTDLRTSDATASSERVAAMIEQEQASIADFERKSSKLNDLLAEAEKNHHRADAEKQECSAAAEKAGMEHEKAKQMCSEFRTKFKNYFGPDGIPVMTANPGDRQKLMHAVRRYKEAVDAAETREKTVRVALSEAHAHAQKMHSVLQQTRKASIAAAAMLKRKKAMLGDGTGRGGRGGRTKLFDAAELERAANRVNDVISVLRRTADRRMHQLNQKRSSSASSTWVQALPGVSGPLKKSLWHKMHRRRQQIVLRPSMASTVLGLKISVQSGVSEKANSSSALRAEQLFLLTAFPVAPSKPLSSVPIPRSVDSWAEPGWHLDLNVPKNDHRPSAILPCAPSFPVLQNSHSEFCSAPGRQAASMIKEPHLRSLTAPLSAAAQAISLAETNPSVLSASNYSERDPLSTNEAALLAGYKFPTKTSSKATSQTRKRTSSAVSKEEPDSSTAARRKTSGDTAASGRSSTSENAGAKERRSSSSKSERTKRSRSKANPETSHRAKTQSKADSGPSVSQHALESQGQNFMQQQGASASAASVGARGVYAHQSPQQTMEQQAAQYNQFMKQNGALQMQQMPPTSSPPQSGQQQRVTLQQLQSQQQQQMQVPPQQQLLQQSHQQYTIPQQQFHQQQQQMAQMRMMQQQSGRQSQVPPPYAQQQSPQGMQAFFPPPMPQQATRQQSYGGQQPMPVALNRSGSVGMGSQQHSNSPSPVRRTSQQQSGGGDDSQHDPLLFLK